MGNCLSYRKTRTRPESRISSTRNVSAQPLCDPNPRSEYTEEEQADKNHVSRDQLHDAPSFSGSAADCDENEKTVITNIQATDVALGLGRIPASFYTVVQHSGFEWKTENKRVPVSNDVAEWDELITIPSDLSAIIHLRVHASFESQPTLGNGELLQELTVTVEELLERSTNDDTFTFSSKCGDVVSPCSSILVSIRRRRHKSRDSSMQRILGPCCSTAESQGELEQATDDGHSLLSSYRKHTEKRDLECSIEHFQHALDICPLDHPCRAAAQANLAMAKFMLCQVDHDDVSFDAPLTLYHEALSARPVGHVDRPSTLIQLARVYFARFEARRDEFDTAQAEALLREAIALSSADSHEHRAATFELQLHRECRMDTVKAVPKSSMQRRFTGTLTDKDSYILGSRMLKRYARFGDLDDLQQAISTLEQFANPTTICDGRHLAGLTAFGEALLRRFGRLGELGDLDQWISKFSSAIDLIPDSHPDKPLYFNNLGKTLKLRFDRIGVPSDLENAISRFGDAIDLTPTGHADKAVRLHNLGDSLRVRFQHLGELNDLELAISKFVDAIDLTPDGHPEKPCYLNDLGMSFRARFEHLGGLGDLEKAISRQGEAVHLTPDGHPDKAACLNNLGKSFRIRFQRLGESSDLEHAILKFGNAVDLTPDGDPEKPLYLNDLGMSFRARFERLGDLNDIKQAISRQVEALHLTPSGHPNKVACLNNVGNTFRVRFQRLGGLGDLEEAISKFGEAVGLTPDSHPHKPLYLSNLGNSLKARFERLGEISDLQHALLKFGVAANLTPDSHPRKPSHLQDLAISFRARYDRLGELSDLDHAISRVGQAVDLTPDSNSRRQRRLRDLGDLFLERFERVEELGDLDHAISKFRHAVNLILDDHPDKLSCLATLGSSHLTRFEHLGQLSDLEQAVSRFRDAVNLAPERHPDKARLLSNLGNSLRIRFERVGEVIDLEQSISSALDAVDLIPDGHPDKPTSLNNLGNSFRLRFDRLDELSDLQKAISRHQEAVDLTPDDHPHKPRHLNNLGNSFITRFNRLGELSDLENAISRLRKTVDLTADGDPAKPMRLSNLGNSIFIRFERLGELSDLEQAISRFRDAVNFTPEGHPTKPIALNNLGKSFRARFEHLGEFDDIAQAISVLGGAVELSPDGHFHKPGYLSDLGGSILSRFQHLGELDYLESAISTFGAALNLLPDSHPEKPGHLINLGKSYRARFERLGEQSDLVQAISLYSDAASASTGPATVRFEASLQWISCARDSGHHSLLHAYSSAVHLLPQLAWIGLVLTHRYRNLMRGADVVREAAAAALDSGYPETAVEWLEQGRSIVWGELFQLRSSFDELSAAYPDHARRLRGLSAALEYASTTREQSLSSPLELTRGAENRTTGPFEQEANRHRTLAIERDKLLLDIRKLPGFERFLLQKEFAQLRASAHSGPVVILNAANSRCDALIILADVENVIHVPLPNFNLGRTVKLQTSVKSLVRHTRGERVGHPIPPEHSKEWEAILSALWKCVIKVVLDSLAIPTSHSGSLPRIFWCPTGPFTFLPFHAAGFYDTQYSKPGHKVFDFVISSYVPTLSILAPSPAPAPSPDIASRDDLHFLAVRQPSSDGLPQLPGVRTELNHIKDVLQNSPARVTLLESSVGTVEEVLGLMKEVDWVHFACHGIQDAASPTDSGLCLADERRLKLSDIIALSRPHGGLAFLSACQTATGDKNLSDEAIHIAAGMLFAGYGGVVGTMWSISDKLAPDVARDVYEELLRGGGKPDYRDAARALQEAVGRLRDDGVSFDEWLPFIHVGL